MFLRIIKSHLVIVSEVTGEACGYCSEIQGKEKQKKEIRKKKTQGNLALTTMKTKMVMM